jgi:hypothetical protein
MPPVVTSAEIEQHPHMSLRMLGAARLSAADATIDVGGGASPLARPCWIAASATLLCSTSPRPGCST